MMTLEIALAFRKSDMAPVIIPPAKTQCNNIMLYVLSHYFHVNLVPRIYCYYMHAETEHRYTAKLSLHRKVIAGMS